MFDERWKPDPNFGSKREAIARHRTRKAYDQMHQRNILQERRMHCTPLGKDQTPCTDAMPDGDGMVTASYNLGIARGEAIGKGVEVLKAFVLGAVIGGASVALVML